METQVQYLRGSFGLEYASDNNCDLLHSTPRSNSKASCANRIQSKQSISAAVEQRGICNRTQINRIEEACPVSGDRWIIGRGAAEID